MSSRKASPLLGFIGVVIVLAFIACDPDAVPERYYREDFESLCESVPCGWERVRGDADQAQWISTIHPGEHALRLVGEVSVRGPGSEPIASPPSVNDLFVQLSGHCDIGSAIRIDVVMLDEFGRTFNGTLSTSIRDPFESSSEWTSIDARLTYDDASATTAASVIAIGITKTGPGVCDLSEIVIDADMLRAGC